MGRMEGPFVGDENPKVGQSEGKKRLLKVFGLWYNFWDNSSTYIKESVVEPIKSKRQPPKYYHRMFRRVPTVDQCVVDDPLCLFEANEQLDRDKLVDSEIISILKQRERECVYYHGLEDRWKCQKYADDTEDASANYMEKYGDLGVAANSVDHYMKQKHKLIWQRRHGKVGSGRNPKFIPIMEDENVRLCE